MYTPVILTGGSGDRLWPISRPDRPKPFISLQQEKDTFLAETLKRTHQWGNAQPAMIVGSDAHRFMIQETLNSLAHTGSTLLLEPCRRNTAAAVAWAALHAKAMGITDPLWIMPADHIIDETDDLIGTLSDIIAAARDGKLILFGIKPTSPHTGYGYIETNASNQNQLSTVIRFIEKPTLEKANEYYQQPTILWNSGMCLATAETLIQSLEVQAPTLLQRTKEAISKQQVQSHSITIPKEFYQSIPQASFDNAVLEKEKENLMCLPLSCRWHDIGTWTTVQDIIESDNDGNTKQGTVYTVDTQNCHLHADHRLLATVGLTDHIVVETADAVLVAHRDAAQQIKSIPTLLRKDQRPEGDNHCLVHRPWGHFTTLHSANGFLVKELCIQPGQKISYQKHQHRSEHWVIVSGTASVVLDDRHITLQTNESIFIPVGAKHRLGNQTKTPLLVVEVQTGTRLEESDIIRFEDDYARIQQQETTQ